MVSKKSLGDLGWEVVRDNGKWIYIEKGKTVDSLQTIAIGRESKEVQFGKNVRKLSFAEIAAILDFIVEDAIY